MAWRSEASRATSQSPGVSRLLPLPAARLPARKQHTFCLLWIPKSRASRRSFFWKQKRKGRRGIFPNDRLTSSSEWERDLFWKAKGRSGGGSETSSVSPRNSTHVMLFHCLLACVFKCLSYQQPSARLHFCGCWDLFVVPPFAWTLPFGKFWLCFIFCCSGNFTLCEKIKARKKKKIE